jgi:hypothetical protein
MQIPPESLYIYIYTYIQALPFILKASLLNRKKYFQAVYLLSLMSIFVRSLKFVYLSRCKE